MPDDRIEADLHANESGVFFDDVDGVWPIFPNLNYIQSKWFCNLSFHVYLGIQLAKAKKGFFNNSSIPELKENLILPYPDSLVMGKATKEKS